MHKTYSEMMVGNTEDSFNVQEKKTSKRVKKTNSSFPPASSSLIGGVEYKKSDISVNGEGEQTEENRQVQVASDDKELVAGSQGPGKDEDNSDHGLKVLDL